MDRTIAIPNFPDIKIIENDNHFQTKVELIEENDGVFTYSFSMSANQPVSPGPVTLRWRLPYINMKGVWKPGALHDKRQQYDWELVHLKSRISVDAPVISVFSFEDSNAFTFACSDAINLVEMNALLREEDNHLHCHITFFAERHPEIKAYETKIRVDTRAIHFAKALKEVSKWWETFEGLKPCPVPALARAPMYSTWYQFHQDLDEDILLEEFKIAKQLGYELIILDDGWQTLDTNRGYDYTGDWEADRFPNTAKFVEKVHEIGMKIGFWYSVPFCGKKSKAYQKFKGKFLTENHRWAPVFDPRYPEVRKHLIDTYTHALKNWKLDAFKLDFIDDFNVYPQTELTKADGRDYANVNAAVDRLLTDVMSSLRDINPEIAIEFRQRYIGPAMRKFGNMFRAFDAPNDPVSNRIRIADVKLLCGNSAVHSDMITWHPDETVELAAIQVLNAMFGVPQMSVHLRQLDEQHMSMLQFYTQYWKDNKAILLDGNFKASNPLGNYPVLKNTINGHAIIGIYDDTTITIGDENRMDLLNAKMSDRLVIRSENMEADLGIKVWNCQGELEGDIEISIANGLFELEVPIAGLVQITRL